jgi:uncharacterized protein YcfL
MKHWKIGAAMLAGLTLLPACTTGSKTKATTPMNTVEKANPDATPREEWIDKIAVSDILAEKVNVTSVYTDRSSGLQRIQLNVQNDSGRSIHVRYRIEWYDEAGFKLYTPSESWNNVTISKGQRLSLQANASSPLAVDWRFSVQESAL